MKHRLPILTLLALTVLVSRRAPASEQPDPGPEDGWLQLRLAVLPHAEAGKHGYDVRVDLLNTTKQDVTIRVGWWYGTDKGDVKD